MKAAQMRLVTLVALLATSDQAHADESERSRTASYRSPSVGRTLTYRIDVPDDYEASGRRYGPLPAPRPRRQRRLLGFHPADW